MKKKILGIFICTILMAAAGLPVVGTMNYNKIFRETLDNYSGSIQSIIDGASDWFEQAKLLASDGAEQGFFGISASIDGDYTIIGAYGNDNRTGSAYIFKRSGTVWTEEQKLTASDGEVDDNFGNSVSIDGDYTIVGAAGDDDNGYESGSAYIFKRGAPDLDCVGVLTWNNVKPGKLVIGDFVIVNNGDADSELDWEIESYPTWGNWTFAPSGGSGLTPAMGPLTVYVEVVAPEQQNQKFDGEIKVVNSEDGQDNDTIPISLKTPVNKAFNTFPLFLRFLQQHPHMFPILRHMLGR